MVKRIAKVIMVDTNRFHKARANVFVALYVFFFKSCMLDADCGELIM